MSAVVHLHDVGGGDCLLKRALQIALYASIFGKRLISRQWDVSKSTLLRTRFHGVKAAAGHRVEVLNQRRSDNQFTTGATDRVRLGRQILQKQISHPKRSRRVT